MTMEGGEIVTDRLKEKLTVCRHFIFVFEYIPGSARRIVSTINCGS